MFNELVLIYLISNAGYFFEYEAEFLLKISKRTIQRYVREINDTHVIGKHTKGLETINENGYKSYHVHKSFFIRNDDPIESANNPKSVLLPIGFMQKHPAGLDSDNQHIVRLTRCALLLHCAKNEIRMLNERAWKKPKDVVMECAKYYFIEMNFGVSLKTFKRDMYLVIDVINFMKDK